MYIFKSKYFEESCDEQNEMDRISNNHINIIYEFLKREADTLLQKHIF